MGNKKETSVLWYLPLFWVAGILVFLPLIKNRFIGDDFTALSIHRAFRTQPFFQTLLYGGNDFFRPMNMALVMGRGEIFGPNPLPFVIANILLHLLNTTLVFMLARKVFKRQISCIVAAALFLVAFSHYEGITWISSSITLLVTCLVLLTLYSHIRYRETNKIGWFILAIFTFVFAFLTKETAIGLPFLICLYDLFFSSKETRRKFSFYIPYVVFGILLAGYVVVQTQWALRFAGGGDSIYKPGWHVLTNIPDYWVWLWMPNPRHPYVADVLRILPRPLLIAYWVLAGLVAASLLLAVVLAAMKKLSKPILFTFLGTFISLAVFLPFAIKISSRYAYLPSCFLALFAGGVFAGIIGFLNDHGKKALKVLLWTGGGLYLVLNIFATILVQREFVKVSTLTENLALQAGTKVEPAEGDVIFIQGLPSHIHLREAIQWYHNPGVRVHADNDKYRGTPLTIEETREFYAGSGVNLHHFIYSVDSLVFEGSEELVSR